MGQPLGQAQDNVESVKEFKRTKKGQWMRWQSEIQAAKEATKKFHRQGKRTVDKFLGRSSTTRGDESFRLNLFHANIKNLKAMMFGRLPQVTFKRTNDDANDDQARVAALIMQRMLNADIGTPNDQYSEALKQALSDRLLPGLGVGRVRYEFEEETQEIAEVTNINTGEVLMEAQTITEIVDERAPIDYVYWEDFMWSPAKTWAEVRWVGFRTYMTRDAVTKRFGEKIARQMDYSHNPFTMTEARLNNETVKESQDNMKRAEVWEFWDKEASEVVWWSACCKQILDSKPDPLELRGFFPCPEPMAANITTSAYMPVSDYVMAEDLYNEVDQLETRIAKLTEAIKVVGVYDKSAEGVKRMLTEGMESDLIPVDNWAMFAEKGGLQGTVQWMPVLEIAQTLEYLVKRRDDATNLLFQVAGISDIMRGANSQAGGAATATERALEARFNSVRVQELQDEFSKYATDLIRLRAEVVAKHFQPESIAVQSSIAYTLDAQMAPEAIQLIKEREDFIWRVEVKPESVAMVDYAQLKAERTDYIKGLATFMQSAAPLVEMDKSVTPALLELLKWGLAGFKGSDQVEGVLDKAIQQLEQAGQQGGGQEPPSDAQIKAQMEQKKQEFEMTKQEREHQFRAREMQHEMALAQLEGGQTQQEIQANTDQQMLTERAQFEYNVEEERNETEEFIKRERARAALANSGGGSER